MTSLEKEIEMGRIFGFIIFAIVAIGGIYFLLQQQGSDASFAVICGVPVWGGFFGGIAILCLLSGKNKAKKVQFVKKRH